MVQPWAAFDFLDDVPADLFRQSHRALEIPDRNFAEDGACYESIRYGLRLTVDDPYELGHFLWTLRQVQQRKEDLSPGSIRAVLANEFGLFLERHPREILGCKMFLKGTMQKA